MSESFNRIHKIQSRKTAYADCDTGMDNTNVICSLNNWLSFFDNILKMCVFITAQPSEESQNKTFELK